jgi:hypothetical protein
MEAAPPRTALPTVAGHVATAALPGAPGPGAVFEACSPESAGPTWLWLVQTPVDPYFATRFLAGAEALAGLRADGVAQVQDFGEAPEGLYLVTEAAPGRPLSDLIAEDGGAPPLRAVRILGDAADALDAAHRAGLLHRELTPAAITVQDRPFERARLSGFALGRDAGEMRLDGRAAGYASPEELRGRRATSASDLYSFACIAFETLTGVPPFPGTEEAALRETHLLDPPPSASAARPGLPVALDEALAAGMAPNPSDRPATAADLVASLARALLMAGSAATAPRQERAPDTNQPPTAPRPTKRGRQGLLPMATRWRKAGAKPAHRELPPAPKTGSGNGIAPAATEPPSLPAPAPPEEPRPRRAEREATGADRPRPRAERETARAVHKTASAGRTNAKAPAAEGGATPRAKRKRARAAAFPLATTLLVIAGTALAGYLVGRPPDAARGARISSGTVELAPPPGWRRATPPRVPGLGLGDPVGARAPRSGARLVAGAVPGLVFPDRLARRVDRHARKPDPVRLGALEAYRWRGLRARDARGGTQPLTLLAAATRDGVVAVVCLGSATRACERAAGSLDAPGAGPASLDALAFYGSRLDAAIARLNRARAADGARLGSAATPAEQASAAHDLSRAHRRARASLTEITVPPGARNTNGAITATLGRLASAYRNLAKAARKGDAQRYRSASDEIERWDRALRHDLARM